MLIRRRQLGASLIETMIAVGILGAIAYFVAGMIRNGTLGQKTLQVQDDARTMTENMAAVLSDPVACKNTLVLVTPPVDPAAGSDVHEIKDAIGNVAYKAGTSYATKSLQLESIQLGGSGIDAKTGIQKWTPLGAPATSGTAFVQVTWLQVTHGGNSTGPAKLHRFFLVNALSLASGMISSCVAQSGGSGGGGGFWTKNATGNIYNNNNNGTGGVGIGTATPTGIFDIYTGAGHAFVVGADGKVGIGTSSPQADLHLSGGANSMSLLLDSVGSGSSVAVRLATKTSSGAPYSWSVGLNTTKALGNYEVYDNNAALPRFTVQATSGNVGIGTNDPAYALQVAGDVQATSFISTSDERLKTGIHPVEGLSKVLQLRGTRFHWRKDGTPAIGLIAQEVEKVFPEIVSTNAVSGFKAIRYNSLLGPLIESIKELYALCRQALDLAAENSRRIAALEVSNAAKDGAIRDLQRQLDEQARALTRVQEKVGAARR